MTKNDRFWAKKGGPKKGLKTAKNRPKIGGLYKYPVFPSMQGTRGPEIGKNTVFWPFLCYKWPKLRGGCPIFHFLKTWYPGVVGKKGLFSIFFPKNPISAALTEDFETVFRKWPKTEASVSKYAKNGQKWPKMGKNMDFWENPKNPKNGVIIDKLLCVKLRIIKTFTKNFICYQLKLKSKSLKIYKNYKRC